MTARFSPCSKFDVNFYLREISPRSLATLVCLIHGVRHQLYTLTVLDKTSEQDFVGSQVQGINGVRHIVRRRNEPYFRTIAEVEALADSRVLQVHDDDACFGFPVHSIDAGFSVLPVRIEPEWQDEAPPGITHRSLLFGAIHPEVWRRFQDFCGEQENPQFALDQVLVLWLQALGTGPFLDGYSYAYRNSNWTSRTVARKSDSGIAFQAEWGPFTTPEATQLMIYVDSIASLNHLARILSVAKCRDILRALILRGPGIFRTDGRSSLASRAPSALRERFITSRSSGSRTERARLIAFPREHYFADLDPSVRKILNGSIHPSTVSEVINSIVAPLETCGHPPIERRAMIWRRQLEQLIEVLAVK
jgi:hypothetical protein